LTTTTQQVVPSDTIHVVEAISSAEEKFERIRKAVGLYLAPAVFIALLFVPMSSLKPEAHRLAAIMGAVCILWITEALPMPVTALVGAALCVVMRVAPAKEVLAPFADPLMFMFIGAFILARAIFLHGLDRRFAVAVLSLKGVGARPGRILFAFGAVTAFISAWIANTAATAMMFAIGMSILTYLFEQEKRGGPKIDRRYATGLMLITTFAASIGGLATPIGTAPNLIGLGLIRDSLHVEFPFLKWAVIGVPVVVILYFWTAAYLNYFCKAGVKVIEGSHEMLEREKQRLGRWSTSEKSTIVAFGITVVMWVTPGIVAFVAGENSPSYKYLNNILPEGVAAIIGAILLFLLPGNRGGRAIDWQEAVKIDWGVVLLYGGGFALGVMSFKTGLAEAVGRGLTNLLPVQGSSFAMLCAATIIACLVSETTSNTASANMVVPVVIALAQSAHVDPFAPALGATFGASLGFMLPVSTPCNAIVYGSGMIPIGKMIKYGILLDVIGVIVIVALVSLLVPFLH
jgi:sodium-dependent dicarboxylate transporter 2/3/5